MAKKNYFTADDLNIAAKRFADCLIITEDTDYAFSCAVKALTSKDGVLCGVLVHRPIIEEIGGREYERGIVSNFTWTNLNHPNLLDLKEELLEMAKEDMEESFDKEDFQETIKKMGDKCIDQKDAVIAAKQLSKTFGFVATHEVLTELQAKLLAT